MGLWLITLIHEYYSHVLKRYLFYKTNCKGDYMTDRDRITDTKDGGDYLISQLIVQQTKLNCFQVEYLFDIKNWEKNCDTFNQEIMGLSKSKIQKEQIEQLFKRYLNNKLIALFTEKDTKGNLPLFEEIDENNLFEINLKINGHDDDSYGLSIPISQNQDLI